VLPSTTCIAQVTCTGIAERDVLKEQDSTSDQYGFKLWVVVLMTSLGSDVRIVISWTGVQTRQPKEI